MSGRSGDSVTAEQMRAFSITEPLPGPGRTLLLEASAGTGKTWTIGALVTRYVAEGVCDLEAMLVVTFSKAASQELRERVRRQLLRAERALADPAAYAARAAGDQDELLDLLLDCDAEERVLRRGRLRAALAAYDGATIATIHQFCQLVLRGLGVAGDTDAGVRLEEDLGDLVLDVADDLFLRGFGRDGSPAFTRAEALAIARAVTTDPHSDVAPDPGTLPEGSVPRRRVDFARAVRAETDRRKRRLGVLSFDDLLSQLADALADEDAPARARMRQRWQVVLVDEFQDTDPVQWEVFHRAFTGHAAMVLIGDPKQAIYGFRGGDVVTYLHAKRLTDDQATLVVNRRSDSALLDGLQTVLRRAALGHEEIVVRDVTAHHRERRLVGAPHDAPFRLRVLTRPMLGVLSPSAAPRIGAVREHVARDLAADVRALLSSAATYAGRPVAAGDVAVLVFSRHQGELVIAALREAGVEAVNASAGNVFATDAAQHWLVLLEALEQPHRADRVRSAALTPFLGRTAAQLSDPQAGERLVEHLAEQLRGWADTAEQRGVAAVLEASVVTERLTDRVLGLEGGERLLTDLRHVGELLHATVLTQRPGLAGLVTWLRSEVVRAGESAGVAARSRRLDSDAAAVQVLTMHGSKGLEFPVVYLPFPADRFERSEAVPRFHLEERRVIDVSGKDGPTLTHSQRRASEEDAGDDLRLLYVAMTRAQSQLVTWWFPGGSKNTPTAELHRLLLGRGPDEVVVPRKVPVPRDDAAAAHLARWEEAGGPVVEPAEVAPAPGALPTSDPPGLEVRHFDRAVDTAWRRTSYTALTRVAEQAAAAAVGGGVGSEAEAPPRDDDEPAVRDDEPPGLVEPGVAGGEAEVAHVASPMADLPVGATFGSLVHAVLEHADPAAAEHAGDLLAELRRHVVEQLVRWPVDVDPDALALALVAVCETPLGPLADGRTLRQVGREDRLAEMDFELPLAGGDDAGYAAVDVTLGDLAPLLRRHLDEGDPIRPYAETLAQPALGGQPLRGYLTGSVDVVLRTGGRYLVVDYKTNWLGPADAPLTAAAYTPARLGEAMAHGDYPLQALLYAVVAHRFLRMRLPGYDPGEHLGGVLYLYLRGLCGPGTPLVAGHPCGVFAWRPPVVLVEAISDLLDGAGGGGA